MLYVMVFLMGGIVGATAVALAATAKIGDLNQENWILERKYNQAVGLEKPGSDETEGEF